ncbi:MAG: sodium:solute symporter family protein [Planctomycetes bacterium]|nr:sodium:solute symporter family protein [Planctomycetota bacterium]MBL7043989.1 sodium:solute symporter family protein [Pirellulaceae bacterium]
MLGLHPADLLAIAAYFVVVVVLGIWTARTVKDMADFVMPRRFGKLMMIFFGFGTGTHSDQAVSVASKSYTNGASGIWYQWLWLFCTPFYWVIAPMMRRFRALTTADVFELRYNRSVAMLFALVGLMQYTVNIGVMLKGSAAVIEASTDGVNANWAIGIMTVLFVGYGMAGGLHAAVLTDFIQGVLTIVFSFLLLPFLLNAVGGLTGMREQVPDDMLSIVAPAEITAFYVLVIALNGLVGIVTQPHTMANCAAGRTELDGQVGWMCGNFLKRICTIAWTLTGVAAVAYFVQQGVTDLNPDNVFGEVARRFLPDILPGLLGLFLAGLLASVMSSCDAFMISTAGLFTENVYKPLFPNESKRHYLWAARLSSLVVVASGVTFAYCLEGVVEGLEIFWKIASMLGIAFWLGLFWRRMTSAGAWAATLGAFAVMFATTQPAAIELASELPKAKAARFVFIKEQTRSPLLTTDQIVDAKTLATRLKSPSEPVDRYLNAVLADKTNGRLDSWDSQSTPPAALVDEIVKDLNSLITGKNEKACSLSSQSTEQDDGEDAAYESETFLWDEDRFAGVVLSEGTRELLYRTNADTGEKELRRLEDDALEKRKRRLLDDSFIGVIQPYWMFEPGDIGRPDRLIARLDKPANAAQVFVRDQLSEETRLLIRNPESGEDERGRTLAAELNRIAAGPPIYTKDRFAEVVTMHGTVKQAEKDNAGEALFNVNAALLEETFIHDITRCREVSVYLPWQMIFYLSTGLALGMIFSLITKPVDPAKLERYYSLIRTPVVPGETVDQPCTIPKEAVTLPRRKMLPFKSLEVNVPSGQLVAGFLAGWAAVAALIAIFLWLIS